MPCERPIVGGRAVLVRPAPAGRAQLVDAGQDLVRRLAQQDRQRGVEHVGRGHAQVQPARRLAGQLLDVGQEGDDVVARALLDLQDARRVELARRLPRTAAAVPAGTVPAASIASQAASSTRSQVS